MQHAMSFFFGTEPTPLICLNQNQIIKKERVFEVRKENSDSVAFFGPIRILLRLVKT